MPERAARFVVNLSPCLVTSHPPSENGADLINRRAVKRLLVLLWRHLHRVS
jgi:hypothetical protein